MSVTASLTTNISRRRQIVASLVNTATLTVSGFITNKRPRQVTAVGSPSFSSSIKKFGSHSVYLPAPTNSSDLPTNYLTIPNSTDFANWGTISLWVYPTHIAGRTIASLLAYKNSGALTTKWWLTVNNISASSGGNIQFNSGSASTVWNNATNRLTLNAWNHVHITKSTSTLTLWVNGTQATPSFSTGTHSATYTTSTAENLRVGWWEGTVNESFYIDELFISSTAISGGTVPTAETVTDQVNVQMLFHFNNDYVDDVTRVVQLAADLTTTATITAIPDNRVRIASASLLTTASQTTVNNRIRIINASLSSTFTLTVDAKKIKTAQAALTTTTTLTATALDLDLAVINLSSSFSASITATRNTKTTVALSSAVSLSINVDNPELKMYYGAGDTSGYITSTSTTNTLRTSFTNRASFDGSGQGYVPNYGWDPVYINFWVKLGNNLQDISIDNNAQVLLYSTEGTNTTGRNLRLYKVNYLGTSRYRLRIEFIENVSIPVYENGGISGPSGPNDAILSFSKYRIPSWNTYDYVLPIGLDLTEWHNITLPLDEGWISPSNGDTGYHAAYITNNLSTRVKAYCDGTEVTYALNSNPNLPSSNIGTGFAQTVRTAPIGGYWGSPSNPTDVYLDQIWIKTPTYSSGTNTYTIPPVSDFYTNGNQTLIPRTTGTTASGQTPQVWLPFYSLFDEASTSPTWNYTKTNQVTFGRIVYASASITTTASETTRLTVINRYSSNLSVTSTENIINIRVRFSQASLTTNATAVTSATKISRGTASLTTTATVTANARKTSVNSSALLTTATATINNTRRRNVSASITTTGTLTIVASKQARVQASLTTAATAVINARKSVVDSANLSVGAFEVTVETVLKRAQANLTTSSALAILAGFKSGSQSNLTVTATVIANNTRRRNVPASITTLATATIIARKTIGTTANLAVQAFSVTLARETTGSRAALSTQATLAVNPFYTSRTSPRLTTTAGLTVTANYKIRQQAALATTATLAVINSKIRYYSANLSVGAFEVTVATKLTLDPYLRLYIPKETRLYRITPESRQLSIGKETNVYKITPETRLLVIPAETQDYTVR